MSHILLRASASAATSRSCVRGVKSSSAPRVASRSVAAATRPAAACSAPKRRQLAPARSGDGQLAAYEEPETAREAIDTGVRLCQAQQWSAALAVFEKAPQLPGTGLKRFRDKPREISDGERMAALFNIACCHSRLGATEPGLLALAQCLDLGFADFGTVRNDPDLETLRADPRFAQLLARYEPQPGQGLFGGLANMFKK